MRSVPSARARQHLGDSPLQLRNRVPRLLEPRAQDLDPHLALFLQPPRRADVRVRLGARPELAHPRRHKAALGVLVVGARPRGEDGRLDGRKRRRGSEED